MPCFFILLFCMDICLWKKKQSFAWISCLFIKLSSVDKFNPIIPMESFQFGIFQKSPPILTAHENEVERFWKCSTSCGNVSSLAPTSTHPLCSRWLFLDGFLKENEMLWLPSVKSCFQNMEICKRRSTYDSNKSLYSTNAVPSAAAGNLTVTFSSQLNQHNQASSAPSQVNKSCKNVLTPRCPTGAFCGGSGAFTKLSAGVVPAGDHQHSRSDSTECSDSNASCWAV